MPSLHGCGSRQMKRSRQVINLAQAFPLELGVAIPQGNDRLAVRMPRINQACRQLAAVSC